MFFEVGKYYRWIGGEVKCDLDFMDKNQVTDGVPRKALSCRCGGLVPPGLEEVRFEGVEAVGNWHPDNFEEVPAPAAQGKRMRIEDVPVGAAVKIISLNKKDRYANRKYLEGRTATIVNKNQINSVDEVKCVETSIPDLWIDYGAIVEIIEQPFTGIHADMIFMDDCIGEVVLGPYIPGSYTLFGAKNSRQDRRKRVLGKIRTDQ